MENKKFAVCDLKVGYVVEHRDGAFSMVCLASDGTRVLCYARGCRMLVASLNDDLMYDSSDPGYRRFDIMNVYGLSNNYNNALTLTTIDRKRLWKREEAKKMTVEEIEKELGYKIEIVS